MYIVILTKTTYTLSLYILKTKKKQNKMKTRIEFTTYVQCCQWALEIKSLFALNVLYW